MVDVNKILNSNNLPTLPAVAMQLLEHSRNPDSEISDYIRTIKSDPAISAKILKTANSSFFGFRSKATTPERAIPMLGINAVSTLALGFSLVKSSSGSGQMAEHFRSYWVQSVVQAIVAESLAQKVSNGMESDFFLAGLMIDLGRLAMLKAIPDEYHELLAKLLPAEDEMHLKEMEALGFSHVEIGTHLMKKWDLPEQIVEAAENHHADFSLMTVEELIKLSPVVKGAAFAAIAGDFFCGKAPGKSLLRLQRLSEQFYNLDEAWLEGFLGDVRVRIDDGSHLFSADSSSICDTSDLLEQANEQLANKAMMAQMESTQNQQQTRQIVQEKEQLESRNRELETQALTDPMTGVFNRRFFDETLKKEIARCQRGSLSVGVLFCDVDNFKKINDTWGHACGDLVLRNVARIMHDAVRASDTLARYGGEEFVAILTGIDQEGVAVVAERIRAMVESMDFQHDNQVIRVTVSIGGSVSSQLPGPVEQIGKHLVTMADEAMYEAKQTGKNRVEFRDFGAVSTTV